MRQFAGTVSTTGRKYVMDKRKALSAALSARTLRRWVTLAVWVMFAIGTSTACGKHKGQAQTRAEVQTLNIKGSDTMVVLVQRWAEAYMKLHPEVLVQVSGGGSGTGIAALINGTTDIAAASRAIRPNEQQSVQRRGFSAARETRVAVDAIAVYVHSKSNIRVLSLAQVRSIFRGQVRWWSSVGGKPEPVVVYSRENNSGTYEYFKEHVLDNEDFAPEVQTLPGTAAVLHAVSHDLRSVGYGGIAYGRGARAVAIKVPGAAGASARTVAPTREHALSGEYPLARYLHLYTTAPEDSTAGRFIAWVCSSEGQQHVEKVGFFPLPTGNARP